MQADQLLYRDFPIEISGPYKDAFRAESWPGSHSALISVIEAAIQYLASLCLSDYRTQTQKPERGIEMLLESYRSKKMTLGVERDLLTKCVSAVGEPLLPAPGRNPEAPLDCLGRFVAAVNALEEVISQLSDDASPSVVDVAAVIAPGAEKRADEVGWWEGWKVLTDYRNKVAHADHERWPIHARGYWEAMGNLLHDGIVELLTREPVVDAVLNHPVVSLTQVRTDEDGRAVHVLRGERMGAHLKCEVVANVPVTERWRGERWAATDETSYVLKPDGDGWEIRSRFLDLRKGVPPVVDTGVADLVAPTGQRPPRPPRLDGPLREGRGLACGTCGEFAQGILSDGTRFHVTCPINKSASVMAVVRKAPEFSVVGLGELHKRKLEMAVQYTVELLGLGEVEVRIRHWSDLDVAKGMGSSTADVLAAIRAVANASDESLDAETEGRLAAMVESSDGTMYEGIAAVNHKTCELIRTWKWFPEFVIVMLVSNDTVDTPSISFAGQEALAAEYDELLAEMDDAIDRQSITDFARQSTNSAFLNEKFLVNPYARVVGSRLDEFGALGINVGHTGTVCGLLFPNTEDGRTDASHASLEISKTFGDLKEVKVVTTPHCPGDANRPGRRRG